MKLHRLFSILALLVILFSGAVPNVYASVGSLEKAIDTPAQPLLTAHTGSGVVAAAPGIQVPGGGDGPLCGSSGSDATGQGCTAESNVSVTKKAEVATVNLGDTARFIIIVKSIGSAPAENVVLKDLLPAITGLSWSIDEPVEGCSIASGTLTCNFGMLFPGETRTVTISTPTEDEKCCCGITNTATVSASNEPEVNRGDNSSKATITVNCEPVQGVNVKVTKTAVQTPVDPGAPISFAITVTSSGGTATGVTLTDPLPANTGLNWTIATPVTGCSIADNKLTCKFDSIAAGDSRTVTITSPTTGVACGTITNTATVAATNETGAPEDNQSTAMVTITCPAQPVNVTVSKTASKTPVSVGSPVSFDITVTSTGPGTASDVKLTDVLPVANGLTWSLSTNETGLNCTTGSGTLTCNFPSMPAGTAHTVTVTSPTDSAACVPITNTASVSAANETAGNQNDNSATATIDLQCTGPKLSVSKTVDARTLNAGELVGYTITVNNTGNGQANSVVLDDALDSRLTWTETTGANCSISNTGPTAGAMTCNLGNIAAGSSAMVHIQAVSSTAVCGDMTNVAFAEAANFARTQSDPAVVTVRCTAGINARLTKTVNSNQLFAGEPVSFTITVSNDSAATVNDVTLNDVLPVGTGLSWTLTTKETGLACAITAGTLKCSFGSMAPNVSHTVVVTSPTNSFTGGTITNTATITASNETAGNDVDNTATASTNVLAAACLNLDLFNGKYMDDFERVETSPIGITNYRHDVSPNKQGFMGQYSNDTVTITLACLPENINTIRVSFDLYIIRSWDGNNTGSGPDHWKFDVIGGPVLLDTTFANWKYFNQSYPDNYQFGSHPAQTGARAVNALGFINSGNPILQDSVYHLTYVIPYQPGQSMTLRFAASGLQPITDESWGMDNLSIVPGGNYEYFLPLVGN